MARPRNQPDRDAGNPPPNDKTQTRRNQSKATGEGSPGGRPSTPASETTASSKSSTPPTAAEDPFAVESPPPFAPGTEGKPNLEGVGDDELDEHPDAHLFDWTPERAGAVIRAGGYVLHTADRVAHIDGGEALWKATEQDALAAGEPLSRILNRYDGARRLAGMVDEAEFAAAMFDYARRNLALRGQLVRREKAQTDQPRVGGPAFDEMAGDPRAPVYEVPLPGETPERIEFDDELPDVDDDPTQPPGFAFDPWAAR